MDFKADGSCDRPPRRVRDNHHHHHPPSLGSASASGQAVSSAPCGACKFLRRKCVEGCMFAPYFGTEQGAARFAAVHKVFGASNVSKLLSHIPAPRRHDAVVTICYEAQARLADPVYGCVATILALQQQVASLQAELALVQSQLINSKLAIAAALQGLPSQCSHPPQHITVLQPSYSNNSSSSNSLANLSAFQPSALDLSDADPASGGFETLQLSQPSQDEDEAEGDSQNSIVFANGFFHQK